MNVYVKMKMLDLLQRKWNIAEHSNDTLYYNLHISFKFFLSFSELQIAICDILICHSSHYNFYFIFDFFFVCFSFFFFLLLLGFLLHARQHHCSKFDK